LEPFPAPQRPRVSPDAGMPLEPLPPRPQPRRARAWFPHVWGRRCLSYSHQPEMAQAGGVAENGSGVRRGTLEMPPPPPYSSARVPTVLSLSLTLERRATKPSTPRACASSPERRQPPPPLTVPPTHAPTLPYRETHLSSSGRGGPERGTWEKETLLKKGWGRRLTPRRARVASEKIIFIAGLGPPRRPLRS
jgi:hypothetical protein